MTDRKAQIAALEKDWAENPRWKDVKRGYSAADVVRLRGSMPTSTRWPSAAPRSSGDWSTAAPRRATSTAMGAITAGQAMQQAKAGLEAIYLSGWQVAADGNTSETMYPDQSLYAYDSVPTMVRRINNTFKRADEIQWSPRHRAPATQDYIDYFLPIVADAEAGFGGVLNAFELMKNMIVAGAAGVHFEDQLAAVKKCGHMGGKVLVPTQRGGREADRRAPGRRRHGRAHPGAGPHRRRGRQPADHRCRRQRQALPHRRAHRTRASTASRTAWSRPSAAAWPTPPTPTWCGARPARPDLGFAREFAAGRAWRRTPTSCWPTTARPPSTGRRTWTTRPSPSSRTSCRRMGYKYQFITLAGIHSMWFNMFDLAYDYARGEGMKHYVEKVQEPEFAAREQGLHLRLPPAGSRRRLLRRRDHRHPGRRLLASPR